MYASISRRIIAFLIDAAVIYILPVMLGLLEIIDSEISTTMVLAGFFSWSYFFIFLLVFEGKTLGSRLVGIQVVSPDFSKLTVRKIIMRAILLTVLIAPVGLIPIIAILNLIFSIFTLNTSPFKEKKQTAWDFASDTCVIKVNPHGES